MPAARHWFINFSETRMRFSKLFLVASTFAAMACASTPKTGGSDSSSGGGSSNMITADQIAAANVPTAYDAVDRLHRSWWRDLTAQGDVVIYMNNQKLGDGTKEQLRQIPASEVESLEYLRGTDATMKFGQDAQGGAIIVTRK